MRLFLISSPVSAFRSFCTELVTTKAPALPTIVQESSAIDATYLLPPTHVLEIAPQGRRQKRIFFWNRSAFRKQVPKKPAECRISIEAGWRKELGRIRDLRTFSDYADNRITGDCERGTKEPALCEALLRGDLAIVGSDKIEVVVEMRFALFLKLVHCDQVVELPISEDLVEEVIQYRWPVATESCLTSQDADTSAATHRPFNSLRSDSD